VLTRNVSDTDAITHNWISNDVLFKMLFRGSKFILLV